MLDVLSWTLGDQEEASVQANLLLGQLLPRHLVLLPCVGRPELRESFHDRAVQLDPLLYLLVFSNRTENVPKFDRFQIFHIS